MDEAEQYHYEQAQAWLEHVRGLKLAEERAARMVELMESIAEGVKGLDYAREHVSGGQAVDRMAEAVSRLDEMRIQFGANSVAYREEAQDAVARLCKLEDTDERDALCHHYCGGTEWADVARMMHYSEARIYQIRQAGVLHAYEVMPIKWRDPHHQAV